MSIGCFKRSLFARLRDFRRGQKGQVAVTMALTALPLMAMVGAGVDYARQTAGTASLQAAVDAAATGATGSTADAIQTSALAIFNASFQNAAAPNPSVTATYDSTGPTLTVSATSDFSTTFMGVVGISSTTITATAKAGWATSGGTDGLCIIALNGSAQKALTLSGSASISASSCKVQVNSNSTDAVDLSSTAKITSYENCFVGRAVTSGSASVSPAADASCSVMADPFASHVMPTVGSCDHTNFSTSGGNVNVYPGVYCGGLSVSNSAVTFQPGLYIIKNGQLKSSGSASFTGSGVSFFLTGSNTGVTISSSGAWTLSAMTSGTLAGFVFFLDQSGTPNQKSDFSGSSQLYFDGIIYLPTQQINLSGSSSNFTPAPFTSYIGDKIVLSGSSTLKINSDPTQTAVPIPDALVVGGTKQVYLSQ